MRILGISAFYHDSAAALVDDGRIVAAAQEERFTRKKHDCALSRSTRSRYCLDEAGIALARRRLRRVLRQAVPQVRAAARDLPRLRAARLPLVPHGDAAVAEGEAVPEAAAARRAAASSTPRLRLGQASCCSPSTTRATPPSAFFPSPFEEAAILTMDGVGEWATTSRRRRPRQRRSRCCKEIHFPHSLGLLYSAFTYYTGFKVNSGEYKVMGLAPYGEPSYAQLILDTSDRPQAGRLVPARPELLRLLHRADA